MNPIGQGAAAEAVAAGKLTVIAGLNCRRIAPVFRKRLARRLASRPLARRWLRLGFEFAGEKLHKRFPPILDDQVCASLLGPPFENLNKTAFNFQFKYLGSITDDFYLGLSTGADVNFTDVEVYDGAINFIPVLASARHYFFEYVYVNVDGGYGFEISQIFQSGIRLQGAVGYSFDGFDLQLGYVSQQSGDFNFSGGSIGAYLHI